MCISRAGGFRSPSSIYSTAYRLFGVKKNSLKGKNAGFPGGSVVENPPANAGDTGSLSDTRRAYMPRSN